MRVERVMSAGNKQIQQYIKPQHNKIYFSLSPVHIIYILCSLHIFLGKAANPDHQRFFFRDMYVSWLVKSPPSRTETQALSPAPTICYGFRTIYIQAEEERRPSIALEALSQILYRDDTDGYPAAMCAIECVETAHSGRNREGA